MDDKTIDTIIKHGNVEILHRDYSNMEENNFVTAIETNVNNSKKRGLNDQLLLLDITNSYISTQVLETFKKKSIEIKPYTKKIAVIGIKGIQKVFFKVVTTFSKSQNIKSFKSKAEALDWLILP